MRGPSGADCPDRGPSGLRAGPSAGSKVCSTDPILRQHDSVVVQDAVVTTLALHDLVVQWPNELRSIL
jgi:hypothetical protein